MIDPGDIETMRKLVYEHDARVAKAQSNEWRAECVRANPSRKCLSCGNRMAPDRKFYCDWDCAELDGACEK